MSTKFTPHYVLNMLQEIKQLSDRNRFNSTQFKKTYPSFYTFRKILINKGLFNKKNGKEKWISIEPNIIMAKSIVRLYLERLEQLKEEKNYTIPNTEELLKLKKLQIEKKFKGKNPIMSLAKQIREEGEKWNNAISRASKIMKGESSKGTQTRPLTMEEMFPMAYEQDRILNGTDSKSIIKKLEDELEKTRQSLTNQETANKCFKQQKEEERKLQAIQNKISIETPTQKELNLESIIKEKDAEIKRKENENKIYKQKLKEAERGIDDNVQSLMVRVRNLRDALQEKNDEIKYLQNKLKVYKAREIMSKPEPSIPEPPTFERELTSQEKMGTYKGSKTYKLFGIPVFSINNK